MEKDLENLGLKVERIAGNSRFETAKLISDKLASQSDTAIVTYGFDFPDALAIASYAAQNNIPILLTGKDYIPEETKEVLKTKKKTIVVGGPNVVNQTVFDQLPGAQRISGENRFETAANIVKELNLEPTKAFVANGMGFADALTGSVLAAKMNAPLLLVEKDRLPDATSNIMVEKDIKDVLVLGGPVAVSDSVVNQLAGN